MIFWEFPKNFQNNFFTEHSWWNTSDFVCLFFKLKISRAPFNSLMPSGNKRSYSLMQTFH